MSIKPQSRSWPAKLTLGLQYLEGKTRLTKNEHFGPLRVIKPYYPERDQTAHVYLLHPPGGLVVGDSLKMSIDLAEQSKALFTVPSAGKVYNVASNTADKQLTIMNFNIAAGASCEWLPQETILFNGANALLENNVELQGDASYCGWEVLCIGRPHCDELFQRGKVTLKFNLSRNGKPIVRDRTCLHGGQSFLTSSAGMQSFPIYGQLFATGDYTKHIESWRELLTEVEPKSGVASISQINDQIFTARYLGECSEQAKNWLGEVWSLLRPKQLDKPAVRPRIWNT